MAVDDRDIVLASTVLPDGRLRLELSVPGVHCGGCIQTIENAFAELSDGVSARVNLSTRRLTVVFRDADNPPAVGATLSRLGFDAYLSELAEQSEDAASVDLLKSVAVAGFAAMNVMMLSVAVWAGADAETRKLFHGLSALIALPTLIYSGRVFYQSAWSSLRRGTTNMDVPVSAGLFITYAISLYDTIAGGDHAWFDAATSLLFFLLIGRLLNQMARARAYSAIGGLKKLIPPGIDCLNDDGTMTHQPTSRIEPGMKIRLMAGDRVPVDSIVEQGCSEVDLALVSGESEPVAVCVGSHIVSGALNLSGGLVLRATAATDNSYVAEMINLMERAESVRGQHNRLADRIAALYAPVVHLTALAAFVFWFVSAGDLYHALGIAVSVLIITCPCALALAVPMVQVIALRRLFESGILIKDGAALEKLNQVDAVIFDKTGTLTQGRPTLLNAQSIAPEIMMIAATLARWSRHPYAQSILAAGENPTGGNMDMYAVTEVPGAGIEGTISTIDGPHMYRLGRPDWAQHKSGAESGLESGTGSNGGPVLTKDGEVIAAFVFREEIKPESRAVVGALNSAGLPVSVLSGDTGDKVRSVAVDLGLNDYRWGVVPGEKLAAVERLVRAGNTPLMVGDGLNDAPALAAASVSVAPANAVDVGRVAADIVLLRDNLHGILVLFDVARLTGRLTVQNISFALAYNLVAIPFAFSGHVTPLVAAIAMSASSIVVVLNALRLNIRRTSGGDRFGTNQG